MKSILSIKAARWAVSFLSAASVYLVLSALVIAVVDWNYLRLHPVAAYEEDLGLGLVIMFVVFICTVLAIPVTSLMTWGINVFIYKRVKNGVHT